MRFGVRVPPTRPISEVAATVRRAESKGFDSCWFPDSHLNYRDVWTTLGAVAVSTDRIQIGPTVTNLVTRHVTVTASAARAVAESAPGRFILGLGAGDSAIGFDGMRNSTVAEMANGVRRLRALLAGEAVAFGRFAAQLRGAEVSPPIYVAGSGPRTLAMAGAVADGVIIMMGDIPEKLGRIRRGAEDAGRPPPPAFVYTSGGIVDDVNEVFKLFKMACIRTAELEGVEVFERAGFQIDGLRDHRMGARGDLGHAADLSQAAALVDHLVPDDAALWFGENRTLVGTEAQIKQRIAGLRTLGVSGVTMSQLSGSDLPDQLIEQLEPVIRESAVVGSGP